MEANSKLALPEADPFIGSIIDHYLITEKIREGAGGILYLARHPALGKPVVIKLMRWDDPNIPTETLAEFFFAEGRAASQVEHSNVVSVFNFGRLENGRLYLVMEYIKGETLEAFLQRKGPLSLETITSLSGQILAALAACHQSGISHRDVKPENLLLVSRPGGYTQVKLIDFGIAGSTSIDLGPASGVSGTMLGTPFYMAPEQTGMGPSQEIDHRADLYSFGIILYRMATGRLPFFADDLDKLLEKQAKSPPEPPHLVNPSVPLALEAVILKILAKHPKDRHQSATEALDALREVPKRLVLSQRAAETSTLVKVLWLFAGLVWGGLLLALYLSYW
jgi:eukaryotic-like serine/threonine-protein kinase